MTKGKPEEEDGALKGLNRTFICSVVFLDIVDYSTQSVEQQIKQKGHLNQFIVEAIKNVAVNDRIILDTGDGAAIGFLGDPEDALFVALSLRDSLLEGQKSGTLSFSVRIGMNLGPVKLVKDINGRPNLIGDGINVAQRVMAFAQPGQVLVSRSYFEVVSCLSQEYAKLFHYLGMKADKHIREHEIYSVEQEPGANLKAAPEDTAKKDAAAGPGTAPQPVLADPGAETAAAKKKAPSKRRSILPFLAVPLAIAALVVVFLLVFKSKPADTAGDAVMEGEQALPGLKTDDAQAKPGDKEPLVSKTTTLEKAAKASAFIALDIIPVGEIYVDGEKVGTAPPMEFIQVTPGRHKIVIKNASYPDYKEDVDLKPSENFKITHVFKK